MHQPLALIGTALCAALLSIVPSGCQDEAAQGKKSSEGSAGSKAKEVQVAIVVRRPIDRVVNVLGSLAAQERAVISTKLAGRLLSIEVDLGSQVGQDEVIAQIDQRDYELKLQQDEAALAQARASLGLPVDSAEDQIDLEKVSAVEAAKTRLEEARLNHERALRLAEEGIITESELDSASTSLKLAQNRHQSALEETRQRQALVVQRRAEMEIARQQLTDTTIRAPFEGVIQERLAHLGEYSRIGDPIVSLVRINPLRLQLDVPERSAPLVKNGQAVRVSVVGDPRQHLATITRISPALNDLNRILRVEAQLTNDGTLHPGAFANAQIVTGQESSALVIPPEAIRTFAGLEKVFVLENGAAQEKEISSGDKGPDWVEIRSGLRAGQQVILNPGNLRTGDRVLAIQ